MRNYRVGSSGAGVIILTNIAYDHSARLRRRTGKAGTLEGRYLAAAAPGAERAAGFGIAGLSRITDAPRTGDGRAGAFACPEKLPWPFAARSALTTARGPYDTKTRKKFPVREEVQTGPG